ncbi:MAG: hypothetical protein ACOCRX_02125, partial [Candidatus Woesearchaeota archaeon]
MRKILFITRPINEKYNEGSKNLFKELFKKNKNYYFFTDSLKYSNSYENCFYLKYNWDSLYQKAMYLKQILKMNLNNFNKIVIGFVPNKKNIFCLNLIFKLKRYSKDDIIQFVPSIEENNGKVIGKKVITLSESTKERILKKNKVDEIIKLRPFINYKYWDKEEKIRKETNYWRKKLKKTDDRIVSYFGEYSERLGSIEFLKKLICNIKKENEEIKIILACRIFSKKEKEKEKKLKEHFIKKGIKNIYFYNEVRKIRGLLNISDITLFPATKNKGKFDIPLVILESLYLGKKTMVSKIPPYDEIYDFNNLSLLENKIDKWEEEIMSDYNNVKIKKEFKKIYSLNKFNKKLEDLIKDKKLFIKFKKDMKEVQILLKRNKIKFTFLKSYRLNINYFDSNIDILVLKEDLKKLDK